MCPGPDHSASDRSLSVLIAPDAPDGFVVKSFAGDNWVACKDYVEAAIRDLPKGERRVFANRPRLSSSPEDRKSWHVGKAFYEESIPVSGTIAETYLRWRGLTLPLASTGLCLAPSSLWLRRTAGERSPAMLARMVDVEDQPTAFHFTYLRDDGRRKIDTKPDRKVFGLAKGGVIRLGPVAEELLIAEGIETALTAMQEIGQTAWAAYSADNLRVLELPPAVRSVIIFPDGDERGTSQRAAASAADRWRGEGRKVREAKVPYNARTGGRAKTDTPATWSTCELAEAYDLVTAVFGKDGKPGQITMAMKGVDIMIERHKPGHKITKAGERLSADQPCRRRRARPGEPSAPLRRSFLF